MVTWVVGWCDWESKYLNEQAARLRSAVWVYAYSRIVGTLATLLFCFAIIKILRRAYGLEKALGNMHRTKYKTHCFPPEPSIALCLYKYIYKLELNGRMNEPICPSYFYLFIFDVFVFHSARTNRNLDDSHRMHAV